MEEASSPSLAAQISMQFRYPFTNIGRPEAKSISIRSILPIRSLFGSLAEWRMPLFRGGRGKNGWTLVKISRTSEKIRALNSFNGVQARYL
jgi:hypothetical protein